MHYYQFNIADYRKDTTHLSIIEHGIYRQLMDWQYLDEQPIPKETQTVMRRLCLGSEYVTQLQNVLSDFFVLSENGYVQQRIFDTIKDYHSKADVNKANGKLGGRPRKQGDKTQSVNFGNPDKTEVKPNVKATNKPLTNNSLTKIKEQRGSRLASDWVLLKSWGDWATAERPDLDIRRTAEDFKDYWHSVAGAKGVKLDWQATWRVWVRGQKPPITKLADVARQTVPSSGEHEKTRKAIEKTFEGAKPPTLEQLAILAAARSKK